MSPIRTVAEFLVSWKSIAVGVSALFVLVGADGRKTATKLDSHLNVEVPALIRAQADRDAVQDSVLETVEALALSRCLEESNAIARQRLRCGQRERQAGVRR